MPFFYAVIMFTFFGMLAFAAESLYNLARYNRFSGSGLFYGPSNPGFGLIMLILAEAAAPHLPHPVLMFTLAALLTGLMDALTCGLLEQFFGIRFWNYRGRLTFGGRVSPARCVLHGALAVLAMLFVRPVAVETVSSLPYNTAMAISSVLIIGWIADAVRTVNSVQNLTARLEAFRRFSEEMAQKYGTADWYDAENPVSGLERLKSVETVEEAEKKRILAKARRFLRVRVGALRLAAVFPDMKIPGYEDTLAHYRSAVYKYRRSELLRREASRDRLYAPSAGRENSFARGVGSYKLIYVFLIGCLFGYVVEMVFCVLKHGRIESRQGMLYGPFNQIYGLGAVLMVLCLYRLRKKSDITLFIASAALGGAFEYLCSVVQEVLLQTSSWKYSEAQLSLGGRTCLTYMVFWGILGVFFLREIYPRMSRFIEKIPDRLGKRLAVLIVAFMALDLGLTTAVLYRQTERHAGIPPRTVIGEFFDAHYTDAYLSRVFPNMVRLDKSAEKSGAADAAPDG